MATSYHQPGGQVQQGCHFCLVKPCFSITYNTQETDLAHIKDNCMCNNASANIISICCRLNVHISQLICWTLKLFQLLADNCGEQDIKPALITPVRMSQAQAVSLAWVLSISTRCTDHFSGCTSGWLAGLDTGLSSRNSRSGCCSK